jgi:hypothetical protein
VGLKDTVGNFLCVVWGNRSIEIVPNTFASLATMTTLPITSTSAYIGDLHHKLDLLKLFEGPSDLTFLSLITARSQASYLRSHWPERVPSDNPNGTPPSDHTVSTAFEHFYHVDALFVRRYYSWVIRVHC